MTLRRAGYSALDYIRENLAILIGLFAMCMFLAFASPNHSFISRENILNVLRQVSTNACLAFGMTFAIIILGIDLSVGSVLALSGTVAATLIATGVLPVWAGVLVGVALGTALGFVNGTIIAYTAIPPFIVTLAMQNIARGVAYLYTNGQPVRTMIDEFNFLGVGYLGGVPLPVWYMIFFFIATTYVLSFTKLGRHIYAVGGNTDAARFSGINIKRVQIFVYTLLGLLAGFSGVILCARMYSGQPTVGQGFELDAIAAAVVGGTSMLGGVGKIQRTILGVFVIGVLNNGLNLMGINPFWQPVIKGVVILAAVYMDMMKEKRAKKSVARETKPGIAKAA